MLLNRKAHSLPDHIDAPLTSGTVPVRLKISARAKRYLLKIPGDGRGPILTLPPGGSLSRAQRFLHSHLDWLETRLGGQPEKVDLSDGALVPLRGVPHRIELTGRLRGLVEVATRSEDPAIKVPGTAEHTQRKLVSWLKAEARKDLEAAASLHANRLGARIAAISVRDTKSRWGSCAANGRLSFSWRLILAPPEILDYVAAHEVAHLKEMNHSQRFWKLCQELAPQTPKARLWLKDHGASLHLYG